MSSENTQQVRSNDSLGVGMIVYSLNVGNAARYAEQKLTPMRVTKVGRKYFWAAKEGFEFSPVKFTVDGWKQVTDYSPSHVLYSDPHAWERDAEASKLRRMIQAAFAFGGSGHALPLDTLRAISALLTPNTGIERLDGRKGTDSER